MRIKSKSPVTIYTYEKIADYIDMLSDHKTDRNPEGMPRVSSRVEFVLEEGLNELEKYNPDFEKNFFDFTLDLNFKEKFFQGKKKRISTSPYKFVMDKIDSIEGFFLPGYGFSYVKNDRYCFVLEVGLHTLIKNKPELFDER